MISMYTITCQLREQRRIRAGVAELADAQASGACGR